MSSSTSSIRAGRRTPSALRLQLRLGYVSALRAAKGRKICLYTAGNCRSSLGTRARSRRLSPNLNRPNRLRRSPSAVPLMPRTADDNALHAVNARHVCATMQFMMAACSQCLSSSAWAVHVCIRLPRASQCHLRPAAAPSRSRSDLHMHAFVVRASPNKSCLSSSTPTRRPLFQVLSGSPWHACGI